VDKKKNMNT